MYNKSIFCNTWILNVCTLHWFLPHTVKQMLVPSLICGTMASHRPRIMTSQYTLMNSSWILYCVQWLTHNKEVFLWFHKFKLCAKAFTLFIMCKFNLLTRKLCGEGIDISVVFESFSKFLWRANCVSVILVKLRSIINRTIDKIIANKHLNNDFMV